MKPIAEAGGFQGLDNVRRTLFDGLVYAMAKAFEASDEVDNVVIQDDLTVVIESSKDILELLRTKLGKNTIINRLE